MHFAVIIRVLSLRRAFRHDALSYLHFLRAALTGCAHIIGARIFRDQDRILR